MEKALYPSKFIRITQKDHEGTHKYSWAVDEAGLDGGIGNFIAPFTGIVKKIYTKDANEVWLESQNKVEFADGTIDYMTILLAHDNNVSNLRVGQVIPQGQVFYQEGTSGKSFGNHVHFEVAKGKFTGTGWHSSPDGSWNIYNGKNVTECLFIDDTYKIINTKGYNFKKIEKYLGTPVARDEYKEQVEVIVDNLRARKTPNGEILGYVNKGIYNINEKAVNGDYMWFEVANNMWIADGEWCKIYEPKPNECDVKIKELNKIVQDKIQIIDKLKEDIQNKAKNILDLQYEKALADEKIVELNGNIEALDNEIVQLQQKLENKPTSVFKCAKTGMYKIKLYEDEELFIG